MENLQDIHDKIFFETKSILETLCKINSKAELLAKQDLFTEVTDRISFLRILEKNEDSFAQILTSEKAVPENQFVQETAEHLEFNENDFKVDFIEEEEMYTNEINDFEEEIMSEDEIIDNYLEPEIIVESTDDFQIKSISESLLPFEDETFLVLEQEEDNSAERIALKERDLDEMEERRRKIVEFSKHETVSENSSETSPKATDTPLQQAEKRFKLAHIKGLKVVQNLFDKDPLEEEMAEPRKETGSLLKSNVQTDFMQAERKRPEFKLDLNDKVAFAKSLFAGNELELKTTIEKLNSFDKLEDAKKYLSEVYYQKDWSKADEFAQRLWNLVESKF